MARAHHEAPKAEKPKDLSPLFDFSEENAEASAQEAPKKRARTAPPIPIEAFRPKKRAKKEPIASEGKLNASVSGEIEPKAEESPYEEMTVTEGPTASQMEAANRESLRAETIELHDKFQGALAEFEAVADAVDRRAKEIRRELEGRNFPVETILVWSEAIEKREGLQEKMEASMDKMIATRKEYISRYEAWEQSQRKDETASAEMEKVIDDLAAGNQPASASFNAQEEALFKKGEDPANVKALAEQQEIEGLREKFASYDEDKKEVILDTQEEIDVAVKEAEDMLKSDELDPDMFDVRDYEFLLTEQARIDRELISAGWSASRKLRGELKEIRRDLDGYESQKRSVIDERTRAHAGTGVLTAREKEDIAYKGPMPKKELPPGSGTTVHKEGSGTSIYQAKKPGFFARLFGRK